MSPDKRGLVIRQGGKYATWGSKYAMQKNAKNAKNASCICFPLKSPSPPPKTP